MVSIHNIENSNLIKSEEEFIRKEVVNILKCDYFTIIHKYEETLQI